MFLLSFLMIWIFLSPLTSYFTPNEKQIVTDLGKIINTAKENPEKVEKLHKKLEIWYKYKNVSILM